MGIFGRISDIFKANVNDTLDKAEDPEKMLKQMVLEMEESVNKSTLAVAQAIANEKSIERKITKARQEEEEWHNKARQALEAGREDLAKAALEKKALYQRNYMDLEDTYNVAKSTATKLKDQLSQLKNKLDEARTRQSTLIARAQSAKAQKQISQAFSGIGNDSFSKFDKYEGKIEKMEAEAEAFDSLSAGDRSLDDEFKKLSSNSSSDADLLKLKAEMGLLDSGRSDKLLDSKKEE